VIFAGETDFRRGSPEAAVAKGGYPNSGAAPSAPAGRPSLALLHPPPRSAAAYLVALPACWLLALSPRPEAPCPALTLDAQTLDAALRAKAA